MSFDLITPQFLLTLIASLGFDINAPSWFLSTLMSRMHVGLKMFDTNCLKKLTNFIQKNFLVTLLVSHTNLMKNGRLKHKQRVKNKSFLRLCKQTTEKKNLLIVIVFMTKFQNYIKIRLISFSRIL